MKTKELKEDNTVKTVNKGIEDNKSSKKNILYIISITLNILAVIVVAICSYNVKQKLIETDEMPISIATEVSDELYNKMVDSGVEKPIKFLDSALSMANAEKPNIVLETYSGETINISEINGPIVLEVVADWCSHCQNETKLYLAEIVENNPDVTFIQYMFSGGKDEVENFYKEIDTSIPKNLVVALQNDELTIWLNDNGFKSFPTFIIFDDTRVCGNATGEYSTDNFNKMLKYLLENPLYLEKSVKNEPLYETLKKTKIAKDYINSLSYVNVPKDYFKLKEE